MEIVKELFIQGKSLKEITEITGWNKNRICYLVYEKYKLPKRGQKKTKFQLNLSPEKINKVIRLKHWGYEPIEISEGENLKLRDILKILELHGNGNTPNN